MLISLSPVPTPATRQFPVRSPQTRISLSAPCATFACSPVEEAHWTRNAEASSSAQLRQISLYDHTVVSTQGSDRWVPQLSSRRPRVVDQGVVWDNELTLEGHLRLRQEYGAKLLWSGDWSTFDAPNFWVTIAPITYPTASGALAWCSDHGFDRNHCYAKLISTTHPVAGSTAFN